MVLSRLGLCRQAIRFISTEMLRTNRPIFRKISSNGFSKLPYVGSFMGNNAIFSELKNGIKVITIESQKKIASLGMFIKMGSRFESANSFGSSRMLFNMMLSPKEETNKGNLVSRLASDGLVLSGGNHREFTSFLLEYMREHEIKNMGEFFDGIFRVYSSNIEQREFDLLKRSLKEEYVLESQNPEIMLAELLHSTAWNENSLGNRQVLTEKQISKLRKENFIEFRNKNLLPQNTLIVGVGTDHSHLLREIVESTKILQVQDKGLRSSEFNTQIFNSPKYVGGFKKIKTNEGLTNIVIGIEASLSWKSRCIAALSVIQSYLGGGSSFSVGGPGKGMYSKLFLDVLNKIDWVESCNCFFNQYSDSGLFGIQIASFPGHSLEAIKTVAKQFNEISIIKERELERAKNSVLSAISLLSENKSHYMEEVSRQILTYSEFIDLHEIIKCVKSITIEDIKKTAGKILNQIKKPTIIAIGTDVNQLPDYVTLIELIKNTANR
ncbi:mitochondrial processing peptidase alpha subunit [Cryptosporidium felis]|nr:mitochondrial processing peptidase alpha subunit [Cryptosporidium felis]